MRYPRLPVGIFAPNGQYMAVSDRKSIGFMAQELQEVFPELVGYFIDRETQKEYMNVNYNGLTVVAIKAIQEQQTELNALKKRKRGVEGQIPVAGSKIASTGEQTVRTKQIITGEARWNQTVCS